MLYWRLGFVLYLEFIKPFSISLFKLSFLDCELLRRGGNSLFIALVVIFSIIVNKPLSLKKVLTSIISFFGLLVSLDHLNKFLQLGSLHLLWVQVVCFSYIQMGNYILDRVLIQECFVQQDVVVELFVAAFFEVVDDRYFGRIILDCQFSRHTWHKRAT